MAPFSRRLAVTVAVLSISLFGCKPAATPERVRLLNELPIEQLRVMLKGYAGDWRGDSDRSQQRPEPPSEKPIPVEAKRVSLLAPAHLNLGSMSVRDAIAARRSVRQFSDAALSREELSFLLWATQGVTAIQRDESGQIVQQFRAAPSAGARYPLETYVAVNRVDGLTAGLYRYSPSAHELIVVAEDAALSQKLQAACYGEPFIREAALVFIWSAIPYRTEWKYTYISHRMIAMEAGHVCENLYLAVQSCGAGACGVMAYHQPVVDELIGADGVEEFTLYLACVGKPRLASH